MPPKISLEIEIEPSGNAGGLENDAEEMDEDEPEEKRRGGAVRKKPRKAGSPQSFKKGGAVRARGAGCAVRGSRVCKRY